HPSISPTRILPYPTLFRSLDFQNQVRFLGHEPQRIGRILGTRCICKNSNDQAWEEGSKGTHVERLLGRRCIGGGLRCIGLYSDQVSEVSKTTFRSGHPLLHCSSTWTVEVLPTCP